MKYNKVDENFNVKFKLYLSNESVTSLLIQIHIKLL